MKGGGGGVVLFLGMPVHVKKPAFLQICVCYRRSDLDPMDHRGELGGRDEYSSFLDLNVNRVFNHFNQSFKGWYWSLRILDCHDIFYTI